METKEHFFNCPYCGEEISVILDVSAGSQSYIEDCEVCCHPIDISYEVENAEISAFEGKTTE
jgi:transcription elongation factor Elf1